MYLNAHLQHLCHYTNSEGKNCLTLPQISTGLSQITRPCLRLVTSCNAPTFVMNDCREDNDMIK